MNCKCCENSDKIPVVAVVGPTASGKTSLGVELAKRFDGEVVSADSMQIYRELSVATAKPTADEMQDIPHHMIGIKSVCDDFSVAEYVELASKAISDIYSRGKLPIIVGGTGLYVDSLLGGFDFSVQEHDPNLREKLCNEYDSLGAEYLHNRLKSVDPGAAEAIHMNNKKRLVRSLELYLLTGLTENERAEKSKSTPSPYRALYIMPNCKDRANLYDKINRRVDLMLENGLINEVRTYYSIDGTKTASQAIGCKEFLPYINNEDSLENCTEMLKQATRRYAKRQLTWFLRNDKIHPVFTDETEKCDIIKYTSQLVEDFLKGERDS